MDIKVQKPAAWSKTRKATERWNQRALETLKKKIARKEEDETRLRHEDWSPALGGGDSESRGIRTAGFKKTVETKE